MPLESEAQPDKYIGDIVIVQYCPFTRKFFSNSAAPTILFSLVPNVLLEIIVSTQTGNVQTFESIQLSIYMNITLTFCV